MNFLSILVISLGLCMDTVSVSVAAGCGKHPYKINVILRFAFILTLFQGGMPLLGWLLGEHVNNFLSHVDYLIAFALLTAVGAKMAWDGWNSRQTRHRHHKKKPRKLKLTSYKVVIALGVATSLDAFAVGFSFAALNQSIWLPMLIIAVTTFVTVFVGVYVGRKLGNHFQFFAEIGGGLLLVFMGLKVLIEHFASASQIR
ncbi:MAG: manganese efflux pump MntP family protein [Microbacter sp.]